MRIIHLILGKANPNRMNGVNKVVNSLATYQTQLGYDVTVWGITPNMEENYPERVYKTELFQAYKNKFKINRKLRVAINCLPVDSIIHIHGGFIPEFYKISKLLVKLKVKYIHTSHGAYNVKAMEKNKWIKKIYFNLFESQLIKNASALHCIGESEVTAIKSKVNHSNCILIPNGQNVEELGYTFANLKRKEEIIFGFCGRIDIHTKGLDYLIKGFAQFVNLGNNYASLWIIGGGEELNSLKQMAKQEGVLSKVRFFGKRYGQEKLNIMANMDVFYHPSRNEGLPGAVLEAAALKVPCVVSKESNMASHIADYNAGISLVENNEVSVCKSMEEMLLSYAEGTINKYSIGASKMIAKRFDWNIISEQLIAEYDKC